MTGPNNVTAMNDILVEFGADGVTNTFRASARSHFADAGNRKGSTSRKALRVITVRFSSLAKGIHQDNCMNLVSYTPLGSLREDCQLQTTCQNSCQIANIITCSFAQYILIYIAIVLARTLDVSEGINITCHGYVNRFTNQGK